MSGGIASRGLDGVVAARTRLSHVDGLAGHIGDGRIRGDVRIGPRPGISFGLGLALDPDGQLRHLRRGFLRDCRGAGSLHTTV